MVVNGGETPVHQWQRVISRISPAILGIAISRARKAHLRPARAIGWKAEAPGPVAVPPESGWRSLAQKPESLCGRLPELPTPAVSEPTRGLAGVVLQHFPDGVIHLTGQSRDLHKR